ncbi:MAG: hypothetical protein AAGI22_03060 [Planctomycetota bacterium]
MIGTLALALAGLQVDGAWPIDVALSSRSDVVAILDRSGGVHLWAWRDDEAPEVARRCFAETERRSATTVGASTRRSMSERRSCARSSSASHAALLDAGEGRHLWLGDMHGGRMGEPRLLAWSRDGERLFHTYASGVMALVEVRINRLGGRFLGAKETVHERGAAPVVTERGLGVRITGEAVLAFDGDAGKVLWKWTL